MAVENTEIVNEAQNPTANAITTQETAATSKPKVNALTKKRTIMYIASAVAIVVIGVLAYYALSGFGNSKVIKGSQVFKGLSNSSLNATQTEFLTELKKSQGISSMHITYYSQNKGASEQQADNSTVEEDINQTVDSYVLGDSGKSVLTSIVTYSNTITKNTILENRSTVYYYNTPSNTITCLNQSTNSSGVINSSISCYPGNGGLTYLNGFPFSVTNVTSLALIVYQGSTSYQGMKTIDGRFCDSYFFRNGSSTNLSSNYSTLSLCIDQQYGLPLYFNETQVIRGALNSLAFTAIKVSTNVSNAEFVIPAAYLKDVRSPE